MASMRFVLFPIRTNKQGVQVNVGKDGADYDAIVNTLTVHADESCVSGPIITSPVPDESTVESGGASGPDEPQTPSDWIARYGAQVSAAADPAHPGNLLVPVTGIGDPGSGVQVYDADPDTALVYLETLTDEVSGGDPSAAPAYDGRVVVGADGTWATTLSVPPGPRMLIAFGYGPERTGGRCVTAGDVGAFNATAKAVVAPAAVDGGAILELADTGSDATTPLLLVAALLVTGGASLATARRRSARSRRG